MNKLFNFLSILSFVFVAGYSGAYAQRSAPKRHNGLSQQSAEKRSEIHDPAVVVDTFGIRVGMTLRQAQEEIKKHGVSFSDLSFNYNAKHWHEAPAPEIFKLSIIAPANYDGPQCREPVFFCILRILKYHTKTLIT